MSGGRERDSWVHDRTINETSSEEEEEGAARQNPLENIAEVDDEGNGNIQAVGNLAQAVENPVPIQVAGNPNNLVSED